MPVGSSAAATRRRSSPNPAWRPALAERSSTIIPIDPGGSSGSGRASRSREWAKAARKTAARASPSVTRSAMVRRIGRRRAVSSPCGRAESRIATMCTSVQALPSLRSQFARPLARRGLGSPRGTPGSGRELPLAVPVQHDRERFERLPSLVEAVVAPRAPVDERERARERRQRPPAAGFDPAPPQSARQQRRRIQDEERRGREREHGELLRAQPVAGRRRRETRGRGTRRGGVDPRDDLHRAEVLGEEDRLEPVSAAIQHVHGRQPDRVTLRSPFLLRAHGGLLARREAAGVEAAERRLIADVDEPARTQLLLADPARRAVGREAKRCAQPAWIELARVGDEVDTGDDRVPEEVRARRERCLDGERAAPRETLGVRARRERERSHRDNREPPHRLHLRRSTQARKDRKTSWRPLDSISTGSRSSPRSSRRSVARRFSFSRRRCSTSPPVSSASTVRPEAGSANGTTTPDTSGKLCSQTWSWTTTGIGSSRLARTRSHSERGGGRRKSETTKTKVPAGTSRRCRISFSSPSATASAGASNGRASSSRSVRWLVGGRQSGSAATWSR